MGGHNWVPQNRGLHECTSGYGCKSNAVYYEERTFSIECNEAISAAA